MLQGNDNGINVNLIFDDTFFDSDNFRSVASVMFSKKKQAEKPYSITVFGKIFRSDEDGSIKTYVETIPRFTYRKGFTALTSESHWFSIKRDTYWGCCLRCGQSMLAQHIQHCIEDYPDHYIRQFGKSSYLNLFNDAPEWAFSIHKICEELVSVGGHEGKWMPVSKLAFAMERLLEKNGFPVYVANDGCICLEELRKRFTVDQNTSVLCLIPLLCGLDEFDMRCCEFVSLPLRLRNGIGFISGLKGQARFFVGESLTEFYYFDPHVTKLCMTNARDHNSLFEVPLKSMPKTDIKSSILLGFTFKNLEEMEEVITLMKTAPFVPVAIMESNTEPKVTADVDSWEIIDCGE